MKSLTKSYNRVFYWRVFKIKVRLHWKLTRLWIAGKLVKLGFWISPDLEKAIAERFKG